MSSDILVSYSLTGAKCLSTTCFVSHNYKSDLQPHSKSLVLVPFSKPCMISYQLAIVTMPCGLCGTVVFSNSVKKWVHKKCCGIKDSMSKVMKSLIGRGCLNSVTSTGSTSAHIGASANLE